MNDIKRINRILCYIPFVWVICFCSSVLIAVLNFGSLPVYGIHPDPYSLSIDWINMIAIIAMGIGLLSIPASLLMTTHLLINKVRLSRNDKLALVILALSVFTFFGSKYFLTNTFEWFMD